MSNKYLEKIASLGDIGKSFKKTLRILKGDNIVEAKAARERIRSVHDRLSPINTDRFFKKHRATSDRHPNKYEVERTTRAFNSSDKAFQRTRGMLHEGSNKVFHEFNRSVDHANALGGISGAAVGASSGAYVGGEDHRVAGAITGGVLGAGMGAAAGNIIGRNKYLKILKDKS